MKYNSIRIVLWLLLGTAVLLNAAEELSKEEKEEAQLGQFLMSAPSGVSNLIADYAEDDFSEQANVVQTIATKLLHKMKLAARAEYLMKTPLLYRQAADLLIARGQLDREKHRQQVIEALGHLVQTQETISPELSEAYPIVSHVNIMSISVRNLMNWLDKFSLQAKVQ